MGPEPFAVLLAPFASGFPAPTSQTVRPLATSGLPCPDRCTVTGVAVAAGVVGGAGERSWRHRSMFHRFVPWARWEPAALGKVGFTLAGRLLPMDAALSVLVHNRLARKQGRAIALGATPRCPRGPGERHDPLRSRG
jgi:hypothetical protein